MHSSGTRFQGAHVASPNWKRKKPVTMFPSRDPDAPRFHLTELPAAGAFTNHLDLTANCLPAWEAR